MLYAFVLAVLVKLLIETESPRLCAGFFATVVLVGEVAVALAGRSAWYWPILAVPTAFCLSYAYFGLLNRIETASLPWWVVLLGGALVPFLL